MARHAGRVRVFREGAETQAEGDVIVVGQLLAAEVDHLVPEQRVADLLELPVFQRTDVGACRSPRPWLRESGRASMCW